MAQLKPLYIDGKYVYLWKYLPSLVAAIIFVSLFTIITVAHCWRMVKTRAWFCIPFAIGGLFQIIGYGTRIYCHYYTGQLAPYAIQSCFILLPPVFYAASIYMILGRLIRSVHGERFSIIRPTRITKIFILGDFFTLSVQGDGAGLTIKQKTQRLGEDIVIAGLLMQLIMFGFFVIAALIFDRRMRRYISKTSELRLDVPWRQGLTMLYACSILIFVRSIFRVVEYAMGVDSYLLSIEWAMYVFDATLMFTVQVIFLVWFPDKLQPKPGNGRLSSDDGPVLMETELSTR